MGNVLCRHIPLFILPYFFIGNKFLETTSRKAGSCLFKNAPHLTKTFYPLSKFELLQFS